jgi:cell division septum initiation protein DivIVA
MSSKHEVIAALDAVDAAHRRLLGLPLHTLTRSERVQLLQKIDELRKKLAAFDRRLIGRLITEAAPAQFGSASWPEMLSRRLRISLAEAERRVAAATYSPDVDRPSA